MKKVSMIIMAIFLGALLTSCASQDMVKKGEMDAKIPLNCPSAEADIRVLQSEKTHASEQLATGVITIVPIGVRRKLGCVENVEYSYHCSCCWLFLSLIYR